nr:uncharacterized protein LOC120968872 [Aegilops tauschii subsp. strangulata]
MEPKKKPGPSAYPSTSKAPPPTASNATRVRRRTRARTLLGKWSEQAVPPPLPPQPTQEHEAPEESSISNTLTATLPKVRARGSHHLRPFPPPTGTTTAMVLGPGRTAALRPPPPRERSQRVHLPCDGPTKLLRPTEPLALERLRETTFRWLPHSNSGA